MLKIVDPSWQRYKDYCDTTEKPIRFTTWIKRDAQKQANDHTLWRSYFNAKMVEVRIDSLVDQYYTGVWSPGVNGDKLIVTHLMKADTWEVPLLEGMAFISFDACVNYLRKEFHNFIMEKQK